MHSNNKMLLLFFTSGTVLISLHAWYYYPFIADDSFISFRYVDRFLNGKGLTWTEGRPVEGYSNLLWILLLTAVKKLIGGELWVIALAVNWLCNLTGLWLLLKMAAKLTGNNTTVLSWSALLFALSAPIAIWVNGGLEAPLVMLLLMLTLHRLLPILEQTTSLTRQGSPPPFWDKPFSAMGLAGVFGGLLTLTRPDGILYTWAITIAWLAYKQPRTRAGFVLLFRHLLIFNGIVLLFYIGQLIFRIYYYGEWVPNTALVKIAFSIARLLGGLLYILGMLAPFIPFLLLSLLFRGDTSHRRMQVFFLTIVVVIMIYFVFIGGDIFPGYRHSVPLVPLLCLASGISVTGMKAQTVSIKPLYYCLLTVLGGFVFIIQATDENNQNAKRERWEWVSRAIGQTIRKGFIKERPTIATTAAGALPYYAGFPTLDMLGLNDYYLPRHPPPDFGKGLLGHELGDKNYYLQQKPDIFFLCYPGLCFRAETALFNDSTFKQDYERVKLRYQLNYTLPLPWWDAGFHNRFTLDGYCYLFIKKYSSRVGIRIDQHGQLIIPAYFLQNSRFPGGTSTINLNKSGEIAISIAPGENFDFDYSGIAGFMKKDTFSVKRVAPVIESGDVLKMKVYGNKLELYNDGSKPVEVKNVRIQL